MSDPRPPLLQRAWHAALLLLGILLVLWLVLSILSKIWFWLLLLLIVGVGLYVGFLWLRNRHGRW